MAGTRSSLAKALTSTKSISKTYLPRREHNSITEQDTVAATPAQDTECQVDRSPDTNHQRFATATSTQVVERQVVHPSVHDAAKVIRNIIRPLNTMAPDSPDRLRRTEIAEVSETTLNVCSNILVELPLTV